VICDYSDVIFVNSESVKSRLVELDLFGERAVEIHVVRLGSFIEARNLSNVRSSLEVLVVATIEPRKGYSEILDAFDNLIKKGFNPIIHIVGRQGWMTEDIIKRIENHKLAGVNLIWHKEITDEKLLELYLKVGATIASSYGEGFGLPIIESLSVKCPVIARNIPVFKELDADNIHYFENGYPSLTEVWENLLKGKIEWRGVHNLGEEQFSYTFENSSQKIMSIINSKF
jgi:glycosyltransferase involved in cell wall biosynthesis